MRFANWIYHVIFLTVRLRGSSLVNRSSISATPLYHKRQTCVTLIFHAIFIRFMLSNSLTRHGCEAAATLFQNLFNEREQRRGGVVVRSSEIGVDLGVSRLFRPE